LYGQQANKLKIPGWRYKKIIFTAALVIILLAAAAFFVINKISYKQVVPHQAISKKLITKSAADLSRKNIKIHSHVLKRKPHAALLSKKKPKKTNGIKISRKTAVKYRLDFSLRTIDIPAAFSKPQTHNIAARVGIKFIETKESLLKKVKEFAKSNDLSIKVVKRQRMRIIRNLFVGPVKREDVKQALRNFKDAGYKTDKVIAMGNYFYIGIGIVEKNALETLFKLWYKNGWKVIVKRQRKRLPYFEITIFANRLQVGKVNNFINFLRR